MPFGALTFMKMCCAIPAISWAGLRDGYDSRFPRYCSYPSNMTKSRSTSLSFARLLGPPEIHPLNTCSSDYTRKLPLYPPPPPEEEYKHSRYPRLHPCFDLFIEIHYGCSHYSLLFHLWLVNCWDHDPLTTLKIIGYMKQHTRSNKHGREVFYTAAVWLHCYHPKTLADNVRVFSKLGCLKDWFEILYRLVKGPLVRKMETAERNRLQRERQKKLLQKKYDPNYRKQKKENVVGSREEKRIRMARDAIDMYHFNPNYRYLFDKISDHFAELLKSDLKFLDSGDFGKISLASKWCPSIDSSYDQATLICESIARRLFPYDSNPEYRGIEEAHYAYRVRRRLQNEVLVPLRRALKLPEIYMSSNEWNLLPYDRVSFTALRTYWGLFAEHDKERFLQYISDEDAKKRKLKISSDREMYPHDVLRLPDLGYGWKVVEMQWVRMVEAFSRKGKFKNCTVCCGEELFTTKHLDNYHIAFQLLVSDLSESPWKGNILRKVDRGKAEWSKIEGDDLESKMECLRSFCDTTRLEVWLLLDKILEFAVDHNISREKMVRRLFVFSQFSFNDLKSENWEAMRKKFEECGYQIPDLVVAELKHWDCPWAVIDKYCNGEIMVIREWSPRCTELFLEQDGRLEKDSILKSLISGEDYMELKVLD